jgi:hypothetical protein
MSNALHLFPGRDVSWYALVEPSVQAAFKANPQLAERVNTTKAQIYADPEHASLVSRETSQGTWLSRVLSGDADLYMLWCWEKLPAKSAAVALRLQKFAINPDEPDLRRHAFRINLKLDHDKGLLHILALCNGVETASDAIIDRRATYS